MSGDSLTYSFSVWMLFISYSYLIALDRIYSRTLNRSGKTGHPWLLNVFQGLCSSQTVYIILRASLSPDIIMKQAGFHFMVEDVED